MKESLKKVDAEAQKAPVVCLCVHGKCKQGETRCTKCDVGWSGTLCDIPEQRKKAHAVDYVES